MPSLGLLLPSSFSDNTFVIVSRNVVPARLTLSFLQMYVPVEYNLRSLIQVCFFVTSSAAAERTSVGSPSFGTTHMIGEVRLEQNSNRFELVKLSGTSDT